MDVETLRSAAREALMPFVAALAMAAGFVLMRFAAIAESYVLLVVALTVMAAGLFTLVFRARRSIDWTDA